MSPTAGSALQLVIVDDHEMVASALSAALGRREQVAVVGVAHGVTDGLRLAARVQPDVALVDFHLPGASSSDTFEAFREAAEACAVLVMTGWPSERALFAALDGGARGFISKDQGIDELFDAVLRVHDGDIVVCPRLLPALVNRSTTNGRRRPCALSDREMEILERLARGESTQQLAGGLSLSPNTVRNHVARLLLKLDAHSRLEAVSVGVDRGLISPRAPST